MQLYIFSTSFPLRSLIYNRDNGSVFLRDLNTIEKRIVCWISRFSAARNTAF